MHGVKFNLLVLIRCANKLTVSSIKIQINNLVAIFTSKRLVRNTHKYNRLCFNIPENLFNLQWLGYTAEIAINIFLNSTSPKKLPF